MYWRICKNKCDGALDITLPPACEDGIAAAEMIAIRHLLGVKEAQGPNVVRGVEIICSPGAVKKIVLGTSSKKGLLAYAHPLLTRYADCDLTVSKDKGWIWDDVGIEAVDGGETGLGVEPVEPATFGPVYITQHAV